MTKPRTALLVEDSPLIALGAEDVLCRRGFGVVFLAGSIARAEALAQSEPIDFALIATRLDAGDITPVVGLLAERQVTLAFACDFADGSDIPPTWAGSAFVAKPYAEGDLICLLKRLGF